MKILANIPLLALLLSTSSDCGAFVKTNLCPELVAQEARSVALAVQVSNQGIEPETLVNELEAYRAVMTSKASAWHYAQSVYSDQKQIPTRQVFFGGPFLDANELTDFEKLVEEHGREPVLIAVGLDKSIGYAPTPASARFVEIVSQLHQTTQVRLLVYSYWDNCITRALTELGIPSH